jgi:hypothetical protein
MSHLDLEPITPTWKLISVVVIAVSCLGAPCGRNKPVSIVIDSPSHGDFLPGVIAQVLPSLVSSLREFRLPAFLNLQLQGVEVSAQGEFMSLFADLARPAP